MFNKLLFVYDETRLWKDENNSCYLDCLYDRDFWDRYFSIAHNLSICVKKTDSILDSSRIPDYLNRIDSYGFNIYEIPSLRDSVKSFVSYSNRRNRRKIIQHAISESDAIIIRMPSAAGCVAASICKRMKKPYLLEVVGDPFTTYFYHSAYGRILAYPAKFQMKRSVKEATHVIYVSEDFMQKLYPTKGKMIGCPDANIKNIDEHIIDYRINKIEKGTAVYSLGLIGSLNVGYRGHKTLIKVLSKLKEDGYSCNIKFLGGGNPEPLRNFASDYSIDDCVYFCGSLPAGEAVLNWIDNIDILVMPTKAESLGRAVIEAMSRGCPVIGTKTTALIEQLGFDCLVLPDDVENITRIIEKMIDNKEYMKYCAYENFYRAHKYMNSMVDPVRRNFLIKFAESQI